MTAACVPGKGALAESACKYCHDRFRVPAQRQVFLLSLPGWPGHQPKPV